jgi:uncharacterized protein
MKIFGISDLHLSFAKPKPMDNFGDTWKDHAQKLRDNWCDAVTGSDIVLVPGDISWAPKYEDAKPDLEFLSSLPGTKLLLKGNHDRWWKHIGRMRAEAPSSLHFLHMDVLQVGKVVVGGTCLWSYPFTEWGDHVFLEGALRRNSRSVDQENLERLRKRELERLKLCLAKIEPCENEVKVLLTHFPPIGSDFRSNPITRLLAKAGIAFCVFGHLHNLQNNTPTDCILDGVQYIYTSSEYLNFAPKLICEIEQEPA